MRLTCFLLAFLARAVLAQDITGTIEGSVLDPSGAAVPQARISVTNTDRNQVVRTITTDTSGVYSATFLPIGNYSISATAAGFKTQTRAGIVLNVNDVLKINITMDVGAVTETVEVTAASAPVELGTPADSTTIEGTQVRELALGTRNFAQLVSLMPGVIDQTGVDELFPGTSGASGTSTSIPFSVNGMRNSANNWTVDGADNIDRGSNLSLGTFPSIDAIAEFKVERSSYTADTGRAGGGQINVVTRSGTNHFHGTLFEFFRNDALNSNNWANNANKVNLTNRTDPAAPCTSANYTDCYAKGSPVRWNDFGGNIGGPVYFGKYNKDHNKTFFFYSEEARRIIQYVTFNPTWPTQGMAQGNLLQPICITGITTSGIVCPAGSTPVTAIPASLINPVASNYLKDVFGKLPLPTGSTTAATTSSFFQDRTILNFRQELVKIDQRFNDKFFIWGKFENDAIPTTEPLGLFSCNSASPFTCTTHSNAPGRAYAFHAQNLIRPNLINDAGFNYTTRDILSVPAGVTTKANAPDVNPTLPFPNTQGVIPNLTFTGGSTINGYGPYNDYNRNWTGFDNLNWIKGRHTFKFGYTFNRYNKTENNPGTPQGAFGFTNSGAPTGTSTFQQSWANFLLGNVATFSQPSMDITPDVWTWQHEAYAQDDFKFNPRLTLYLGVRWSFFSQPTDAHGLMDNFDPALYSRAAAPAVDPANGNFVTPIPVSNPPVNGIIIGGKNSPFGGNISNNSYKDFAPRFGIAWDPFGDGKTAVRSGYGVYYDSTLFGTYEQNIFTNPPFVQTVSYANGSLSNITAGTVGTINAPLTLHATQLPAHVPYSQQWNFSVQRQIASGTVVQVAYVGSKGTHLLGIADINQAPPGLALANGLHTVTATNPTQFTSSDIARINNVRPYYGYGPINALETAFDSNYHSLQITFQKRFHSAGQVSFAYTYSKNLTDNGSDRSNAPQNSYNWHEGEYARYPGDRTSVFTANYVYTLPFFRHSHGLVAYALSGWEFSGIVSAYTGAPFTVTTGTYDPAGLGVISSGTQSQNRPDMVCNPNANHASAYGASAQEAAQSLTWFNTACFAAVPQGAVRPGNAGRSVVQGPGFFNLDASLIKNFKITERITSQLRGESFNTLNWVNPSGFASLNNTATNFGQINSFRAARRIQLALKLLF
jgi:hypothetical protein